MKSHTIDELQEALSKAKSWSELFLLLGLPSQPGGNAIQQVRNSIRAYGLCSKHLNKASGPKVHMTHEELSAAIDASSSWAEVARRMGASHSTVKKIAVEMDIDFTSISQNSHVAEPLTPPLVAPKGTNSFHHASESLAAYWYEANGYEVFKPLTDGGTDLLISDGGIFSRVQVKSSVSKSNAVGISRNGHKGYLSTEVDEFFVVMADSRIYRLPFDAVGAKVSLVMSSKYDKYRVELF